MSLQHIPDDSQINGNGAQGSGPENDDVVTETPIVNINHWQKGQRLGQGSFATVYEGISSDGIFFAIKEVSLNDEGRHVRESILSIQQEIELLSKLKHNNIVQYIGTAKDDANLYIFLELVTRGSLASLYETHIIPDYVTAAYARQILSGLDYLHSQNIVHGDVRCAKILVASDGTVKLSDFGLSKVNHSLSTISASDSLVFQNELKSRRCNCQWMAPEVVDPKNESYESAADIWSFGCTVLEMAAGQRPYHQWEGVVAIYKIYKGELPPMPETLSTGLRSFILRCLRVNPDARPSAALLLDDPFLKMHS